MAMRLTQLLFLSLLILLFSNFSNAQNTGGAISGSVLDEAKKPLDGATVVLLVAKDSSVVSSQLAGTDGSFAFQNLMDNTYLLKVTYIGYKTVFSKGIIIAQQNTVKVPAFDLAPAGKTLNEVAVTAKKSFVEQKIDRTVINVGALISNTGTNALEVLEKTPGVQVDPDGNITFKGKSGVLVMIDDKPTYLSATNLLPTSSRCLLHRLNFNKNFGRVSIQTGLRVENTNGNGNQLGNADHADSSFVNHYTNLFPTAYVSYNLDTAGHNVLVASYGRRIGRPNYGSLNPFTFFVDEFTYFSGNPFLKPQFTDNYKLAYSYRSLFTVALA
jgi:hypothetical protein